MVKQNLKVAIVHYWLDSFRGGEKVIEALCELYPEADIYTHIYKPENLPETITRHKVYNTFISKLPFAKKYYRHYLPLMPIALLFLNLKKYDLIISSESGPAKGVRKRKDALNICYCHSPMRYIWDMEEEYISGLGIRDSDFGMKSKKLTKQSKLSTINYQLSTINYQLSTAIYRISNFGFRICWRITAWYMRIWDKWSAKKVDYFIANSKFIATRIRKFYGREASIIHPPVDINRFTHTQIRQEFYLCASQLVSYKKVDLVIDAFNKLGLPLVVIGGGDDFNKIKSLAKPNIKILGKVSDEILKESFEKCKAFVFAGKEDFGIVFAEALSAGAPIIAYGKGGVKDIVIKNKTGIFFYKQDVDSICKTVHEFESGKINLLSPNQIAETAKKFSKALFTKSFEDFVKCCKIRGLKL